MMSGDEVAAKALFDLVQAGAAMTADETFGMQLALPDGAPNEAFEVIYATGVETMNAMVIEIARRRGVRPEWNMDTLLTDAAFDAFDRRWDDISARLVEGGRA